MDNKPLSARDVAVMALRDRSGNVSDRLVKLFDRAKLSRQDRALARELVMGVIRRRGTLDAILKAFLLHPGRKLPAPLTEVLQVAIYQLAFLQGIPDFAAVDQAVQQALRMGHRRRSGLVNGVLRSVARCLGEVVQGPAPMSADVLVLSETSYKVMNRPIFADPASEPVEYLAGAHSLPLELARRWLACRGNVDAVVNMAIHANTTPPMVFRVNRLRATVDHAVESVAAQGLNVSPHVNGMSIVIQGRLDLAELNAFNEGWLQVQDPTASDVSIAAACRPGQKVLDLCAAPGTKTTHMAELMENRGSIVAVDVSQEKTSCIEDNCRRMGITTVETLPAAQVTSLSKGSFDLALVDAPCSNTGVLARRPEARWRFHHQKLPKVVALQKQLVVEAARFVRQGGRLVYSTCSIEEEECGDMGREIPRLVPTLKLIEERLTLPRGAGDPTEWRDGGYYALFQVV